MNMTVKSLLTLAAAAAAMMAASCSKESGREAGGDLQLRLSSETILAETRVSGDGLQLTQFADGEKVAIFFAENVSGQAATSGTGVTLYTQPLKYTAGNSGSLTLYQDDNSTTIVPQYWPTSGNGLFIYGVYPATAASSISAQNSFSVQTNQSTDEGYKASDLMTGVPNKNPATRTTNDVTIKFTHRLSKINISLMAGEGFSSSDLSSASVSIINTLPTVTFAADGASLGAASGSAQEITVCSAASGSAIIVPQKVDSGTGFIKVTVGGGSYVYKFTSDVTFEGGKAYTYNITVNKTGLSVKSEISAWTTGGSSSGAATLQ